MVTAAIRFGEAEQRVQNMLDDHPYQGSSLERWHVGHHLFFVEIQAIVISIDAFERNPTETNLRVVTDLIRGSATSMQFAGNFTRAAYEPVRSSMEHLDKDFSGIFSADHRIMIRKIAKLKRAADDGSAAYCDLKDAIEVAYKAHAHVCRRFIGDAGSLANNSVIAWQTILNKFMPRTLAKIGIRHQSASSQKSNADEKNLH